MALEPERPIEASLRAAARKRREEAGPPFELHPADRRMLQAEVARVHRPVPASPKGLWARLRTPALLPRLAWSLGILVVLALGVWSLRPPPSPNVGPLALDKPIQPDVVEAPVLDAADGFRIEKTENAPSLASAPAAERQTDAAKDEFKKEPAALSAREETRVRSGSLGEKRDLSVTETANPVRRSTELRRYAAKAPPAPAPGTPVAQMQPNNSVAAESSVRALSAGAAPAGAAVSGTAKREESNLAYDQPVQKFSRDLVVVGDAWKEKSKEGVLRSFTFQATGSRVVIKDADESVYSGYAEAADKLPGGFGSAAKPAVTLDAEMTAAGPAADGKILTTNLLAFRVVGTNLTSKEKVVFSGTLVPTLNTNFSGGPLSGYRIEGSAEIGSRLPLPVQARPVPTQ